MRRRLWRFYITRIAEPLRLWKNRKKPSASLDIKDSKHKYTLTLRR